MQPEGKTDQFMRALVVICINIIEFFYFNVNCP